MLDSGRSAPDFAKKTVLRASFSAFADARVRVARLRFLEKNRAWFLSSMLVRASPRRICRENPAIIQAPHWEFAKFAIS